VVVGFIVATIDSDYGEKDSRISIRAGAEADKAHRFFKIFHQLTTTLTEQVDFAAEHATEIDDDRRRNGH
jgi:hypothetical protein